MSDVEIRSDCYKSSYNSENGISCTDDDRCPSCVMKKHREENAEIYQKMGEI